ncbi:MAG: hypothetical protein LQ348_004253 [Seirophora lacunosa]|nr:MAG: hypothetical protein LQ348_004253 [Seirophora lacunosa]
MAAAITSQSPLVTSIPSAPKASTPSSQRSDQTSTSKSKRAASARDGKTPRGKRERPCDACRKRKSKCVMNEGTSGTCAACAIHKQQCTFVEDPQPRKRRLDHDGKEVDSSKRRSTIESHNINAAEIRAEIKTESELAKTWVDLNGVVRPRSELLLGNPQHYGTHIGYTTELEPILFDIYKAAGKTTQETGYQKPDPRNAFLVKKSDDDMQEDAESEALTLIESLIGAHGAFMIRSFRDGPNRSFPVVEQPFFNAYNERQSLHIEPGLLAAMYTVAASSSIPNFPSAAQLDIDLAQLEEIAFRWFENSLQKPTLATIQTGILLMQRPSVDTKTLNSQLVSAAYELGLNLDCTPWALTDTERSLRKRLAWALYMQDKWCALVHGRPSLIPSTHWAVRDLVERDFKVDYEGLQEVAKEEMKRGRDLFAQMASLTEILSTILETFYTLKAMQEVEDAGEEGTRMILNRAKPIQIRLKDWFAKLPKGLKMDSSQPGKTSSIGHLHLAYFATEITLHRCIIRSLSEHNKDAYVSHVCRSAAKTRLISAMDFTNRLRPEHLTSFWYFPSKTNFSLIGTFGSLLLATAPGQEEADFYRTRLAEFRWTLCVSSKNANFLNFAVESLDSNLHLLQALPPKPSTRNLSKQMPAPPSTTKSSTNTKALPKIPPKPLQRPSPPQDDSTADFQPLPPEISLNYATPFVGSNGVRQQHSAGSLASQSGLVSPSVSRTSSDQDNHRGSHESLRTGYSQHSGSVASHSAQHSGSGASDFLPRSTSRIADPQKILSKISEARSSMIREQEAQSILNSQRSSAAQLQQLQQQRPSDFLLREDSWTVPPQYDQPRNSSSQLQYATRGAEPPASSLGFPGGGGGSQYGGGSMSGIDSYYGESQLGGYAESSMAYGPGDALAAQQQLAQQQAMQGSQQGGRMWFIEGLHDDQMRMA